MSQRSTTLLDTPLRSATLLEMYSKLLAIMENSTELGCRLPGVRWQDLSTRVCKANWLIPSTFLLQSKHPAHPTDSHSWLPSSAHSLTDVTSPTTIKVNSNPFFTDLRWARKGRLWKPRFCESIANCTPCRAYPNTPCTSNRARKSTREGGFCLCGMRIITLTYRKQRILSLANN